MNVWPFAGAGAAIDLAWSQGQVSVTFPNLFALTAHASVRRFVERVLQLDEITFVFVQFGRGTALLAFDDRRATIAELLVKLARVLRDESAGSSSAGYLLADLGRERSLRKSTRFRPIRDEWQVAHEQKGEVCVRSRLLEAEPRFAAALAARLAEVARVASARVGPDGRSLRIKYVSDQPASEEIRGLLDQAVTQVSEQYWAGLREATEGRVVIHGVNRVIYVGLTLAGFVMMVVALILPGIPTPPFLIATTYFGVQSSPRFYRWLSRSWLFGRMIRDWRDHRALRFEDKIKSILLTLLLIAIGVVLLDVSGPLLIVVLSMAAIEIVWLLLVPEILVPGHGRRGKAGRLSAALGAVT